MANSTYEYTSLSNASEKNRVLKVLPGHDTQPICISLKVVSLHDVDGKFDALSYM